MAFKQIESKLKAVRVISPNDPALDIEGMKAEGILEDYLEDPLANEHRLKFLNDEAPTVFICNFELTGKESAAIKDAMAGVDHENNTKLAFGSWEYSVVKIVLKEIENPGILKFKKDPKGYVSDFTMSQLERFDVVSHIFRVYNKLTNPDLKANTKN